MNKLVLSLGMLLTGWIAPAALSAEADLAACYQGFCTGEVVFNVERDYRQVQLLGIDQFGKFTIRFLDNGGIGGNWDYFDFAKKSGCIYGNQFCVGNFVKVIPRNLRVAQVVGIHADRNRMVIRFQDTGGVGGNWGAPQLIRLGGGPGPTPYCPPGTHFDPVLNRCVANNPPPPPPPHLYTCSIYHFVASNYNVNVARQQVLQQCALASGGYVCQGSMVTCH